MTLVGDAAHTHGGAFAAGGSLAIDDAYALSRALVHVWPASSTRRAKPTREEIAEIFKIYEASRQPHVNRLLGVVHQNLAVQKTTIEGAKTETDEQLRQRVSQRIDPSWISEHDVENAFEKVVEKEELRAKL